MMANEKRSGLFSRLRDRSQRRDEDVSEDSNAGNEKAKAGVEQPKVQAPEPVPGKLHLPLDHPIYRLVGLYKTNSKVSTTPVLEMHEVLWDSGLPEPDILRMQGMPPGKPPAVLPQSCLKSELSNLERQITLTASTRAMTLTAREKEGEIKDVDAFVQVFITANKCTAWILNYPPSGQGAELNVPILSAALEKNNITYGIDRQLLQSLPGMPERYFHLYLIAWGIPPIDGKDGFATEMFVRKHVPTLPIDDNGRVDFAGVETFQNVKEDEVISRLTMPTPHRSGWSVLGQEIRAKEGKKVALSKGRNTVLSPDGMVLKAACTGHVEFNGRSFAVLPVLEIPGNVDYSTGNINCLGDVHIHGDVCSGFSVRATGSITVDGMVESCTIEAGNDLIVRKGIQGNNQAVIRSHRYVLAKYIENCSVYARENLETECIINSEIYSDGKVTVRSGRGAIIGGEIRAAFEVSANTVGVRSEVRTAVYLGGRPCEDFERENLIAELERLENTVVRVERQPESSAKLRDLSKLRVQISANKLKRRELDKQLKELGEAPVEQGRLVCNTLYPGTLINQGSASFRVSKESKMCSTQFVGGEILLY